MAKIRDLVPAIGPMQWTDDDGVIHLCEGAAPLTNERLIWTLCDREIESNALLVSAARGGRICGKCAAADTLLKHRLQSGRWHLPQFTIFPRN